MALTLEYKFWRYVDRSDGCWIWRGDVGARGYGRIIHQKKSLCAHRVSVLLHGVNIPDGLVVDHQCRNKLCVNPSHLRVVTQKINSIENSSGVGAINMAKTHCVNGHEFTLENTSIKVRNGTRRRGCRICNRNYTRKYDMKRRRKALGGAEGK